MQYFGCNITVHPESFNGFTAINDPLFNSGMIFAYVASFGRCGQYILSSLVYVI